MAVDCDLPIRDEGRRDEFTVADDGGGKGERGKRVKERDKRGPRGA